MTRLFIAVELPAEVRAELGRLAPRPTTGLRLVQSRQMHLTLHFLGDGKIDQTASALTAVNCVPFQLRIKGVGRFPPRGRATTLWAGIENSSELLMLHAEIGKTIQSIGFTPDSRPFSPHITLARCGYRVNPQVVDEFLAEHEGFSTSAFPVEGFALYSSTLDAEGPTYQIENLFKLQQNT